MTEERMKEYFNTGGEIFRLLRVDSYRDGGTIVIETSKGTYYGGKESKKLHTDRPTTDDNLLQDPLKIEFLLFTLERFLDAERQKVSWYEATIDKLKFANL